VDEDQAAAAAAVKGPALRRALLHLQGPDGGPGLHLPGRVHVRLQSGGNRRLDRRKEGNVGQVR